MASKAKQLDILSAYRAQKRDAGQERTFKLIAVVLIVAVMFGCVGTFYYMVQRERAEVTAQIDEIELQLNSEEVLQQIAEEGELNARLASQLAYNEVLSTHLELLGMIYRPDSDLFSDIEALAVRYEVACTVLNYADGTVTLECTGPSGSAAASFAKALEENLLNSVVFYGYTYIENADCYGFTVEGMDRGWGYAVD